MNRSRRNPFRKGFAAGISMLMLTLSVAVPVLEMDSLFDQTVVENPHDPGECPSGHDHTVCTQVGANLAFEGHSVESPEAPTLAATPRRDHDDDLTARAFDPSNRTRAPPLG